MARQTFRFATVAIIVVLSGSIVYNVRTARAYARSEDRLHEFLELPLQPLSAEALDALVPRRPGPTPGLSILLGTAAGCPTCGEAVSGWASLIARVKQTAAISQIRWLTVGTPAPEWPAALQDALGPGIAVERISTALTPAEISVRTGLRGVPFAIIADDTGILRHILLGALDAADISAVIKRIAAPPASRPLRTHVISRPYVDFAVLGSPNAANEGATDRPETAREK